MAELDTSSSGGKSKGGKRSKKQSTRVDLTAMVDLGFLLITFFMLATTFAKPKTMEVNMPDKDDTMKKDDQPPLKLSKSMSVLLGERGKVYTYVAPEGTSAANLAVDSSDFSADGFRQLVLKRQKEVAAQWGNKDELVVLIKSMPKAPYKSLVDVLDEMNITDTKRYAIVDIDNTDRGIMKSVGAAEK
jgi:biopolymer transport protein ExbD